MRSTPLLIIFLFILSLGFASCSKTTDGNWVVYQESTYLPFWAHKTNVRKSKNTLTDFLKTEGIIPLKVKTKGERDYTCEDCNCLTGLEYQVQVDKSQVVEMLYWGFELK